MFFSNPCYSTQMISGLQHDKSNDRCVFNVPDTLQKKVHLNLTDVFYTTMQIFTVLETFQPRLKDLLI